MLLIIKDILDRLYHTALDGRPCVYVIVQILYMFFFFLEKITLTDNLF